MAFEYVKREQMLIENYVKRKKVKNSVVLTSKHQCPGGPGKCTATNT